MFDCGDDAPFEMHRAQIVVRRESVINDAQSDQRRQAERLQANTNWERHVASDSFLILSISCGPLTCHCVKTLSTRFEKARRLDVHRILGTGVGHQRRNGEQYSRNCQCRRPLPVQKIKTNRAIAIDVRVEHLRGKRNFWWLERILGLQVVESEQRIGSQPTTEAHR